MARTPLLDALLNLFRECQASWAATRAQSGAPGILVGYSAGSLTDSFTSESAFATASNAAVRADAVTTLGQLETVFPGLTPR